MTKPYILAVASHKGGTGRTTSALTLAWALGESGHRVILIDADEQRSASALALDSRGEFNWANVEFRTWPQSLNKPMNADIVVIDKVNGGSKSDAVNAGFNAASGTLVLSIDADTLLEPDALSRAVIPFLEDQATVAVGGNIAISNGCRIVNGHIEAVALPRSWLARFQIVEYMRAFCCSGSPARANGVVLISGRSASFAATVIAVSVRPGGHQRTWI